MTIELVKVWNAIELTTIDNSVELALFDVYTNRYFLSQFQITEIHQEVSHEDSN